MPLSNATLPFNLPERALPYDGNLVFAQSQTLTATGYFTQTATQIDVGIGRFDGYLVLDISAIDFSSTDETYRIFLMGSNDSGWTSGNIEILAVRDFAAVTAGRLVATIVPASYALPVTGSGRAATKFVIPVTNFMGAFTFRYLQVYLVAAGTTPSITASVWLAPNLQFA